MYQVRNIVQHFSGFILHFGISDVGACWAFILFKRRVKGQI